VVVVPMVVVAVIEVMCVCEVVVVAMVVVAVIEVMCVCYQLISM